MARSMACAGVTPDDIVQNAYGYGLFTGGLGFHQGAKRLGASVLPTSTGSTKKQLKFMHDMKSTVIACTPSYAAYLAEATPETKANGFDTGALTKRIQADLQAALTVRAGVELLDPGALPRSQGKAVRVIDLRKEQA